MSYTLEFFKKKLEQYFMEDYTISGIHKDDKGFIGFKAKLKDGHPEEALFMHACIEVCNIHWNDKTFDACIREERFDDLLDGYHMDTSWMKPCSS